MGLAGDIVMVIVAAFVGGLIAQRLRVPLMLGYIAAGVLVGPYTAGPTVTQVGNISLLADIGVALLMFTIGLDFPFKRLAPVRNIALAGTPLQIALSIGLGLGIGHLLGWDWTEGVWLGALLSLSSTVVVLRTLADQRVLGTLASRVMLGILVVQDLAAVPLMILLPELRHMGSGLGALGWAALRALVLVGGMAILGTRALPWAMATIARWNSRELFLITVVAVGLGVGYATYLFGLSFAFGALLAGMVLSESEHSFQALSEITPLRDVFAMVFFVSVGMLIDPVMVWRLAPVIAVIVLVLLVGKGTLLALLTRLFGYGNIAPLAVGLGLFQMGEFSFVLARAGLSVGALSSGTYAVVLASAVITMGLTPFTSRLAAPAYAWWRRHRRTPPLATVQWRAPEPAGHVVVCGYGRVGRVVATALHRLGQDCLVIELDATVGDTARAAGLGVVYGDAGADLVLRAAGVERARLTVVTIPDALGVRRAVAAIRRRRSDAPIVSRAASVKQIEELAAAGVRGAVQPEVEAGVALLRRTLNGLGLPSPAVDEAADVVRAEVYREEAEEAANPEA